jgi:hypothetical protein
MGAVDTAVHALNLLLKLLDDGMAVLQILVQPIPLGDELLLPLPEPLLLDLDLLRKPLPQRLFLFLELGVVELAWTRLAKLARLHLLCAVGFVVVLLSGVDKVEHVGADEDGAQALEVAVLLVLNLSHAPGVLAALDGAAVARLHVLLRADDREGHGGDEVAGVLEAWLVVLFERGLIDLDALGFDDGADLQSLVPFDVSVTAAQHTLCLNLAKSAGLKVSAFATTGMRLTLVQRRFMTSMSNGFRVWPVGRMK